jgi:hypothetical protein
MAILQLPYNLSALFNFNEPDTNEGAMESSDEDFFDLSARKYGDYQLSGQRRGPDPVTAPDQNPPDLFHE